MRVVVVEDEQSLRDLYSFALEQAGHTVRTFDRADTAQRWDGWGQVDVALCDLMLPGHLSGADLVAWLTVRYPNVKLIVLSAIPFREVPEHVLDAAVVFTKPTDFSMLLAELETRDD